MTKVAIHTASLAPAQKVTPGRHFGLDVLTDLRCSHRQAVNKRGLVASGTTC